jgi:hypothetical protein
MAKRPAKRLLQLQLRNTVCSQGDPQVVILCYIIRVSAQACGGEGMACRVQAKLAVGRCWLECQAAGASTTTSRECRWKGARGHCLEGRGPRAAVEGQRGRGGGGVGEGRQWGGRGEGGADGRRGRTCAGERQQQRAPTGGVALLSCARRGGGRLPWSGSAPWARGQKGPKGAAGGRGGPPLQGEARPWGGASTGRQPKKEWAGLAKGCKINVLSGCQV